MWFMNKIANPFVRLILRSPLHGWFSSAVLLLTYRGRKSGKTYTLPVQYAQEGNTLYILPGAPQQKTWWRNLRGGAPLQIHLRGTARSAQGLLLEPEADREGLLLGLRLYLQRFPALAKNYHVHLAADGRLDPEGLTRAAATVKMVRVELNPDRRV